MREGFTVFEELIRIGDLQSKVWYAGYLENLENPNKFQSGDYIVGKILLNLQENFPVNINLKVKISYNRHLIRSFNDLLLAHLFG